MTRSVFWLTSDSGETSFPNDESYPSSSGSGRPSQDYSRYTILGLGSRANIQYPLNNDGYNIPYLRFVFLDAFGTKIDQAPRISLKLPNQFNLSNFSDYSKTDNIFGGRDELSAAISAKKAKDATQEGFDPANYVSSAGEAFQYTLERGLSNILGFIGSAGLNSISQYEFLQRQAVNPQAQLLYKGPQFRKYQIPVTMRPRNQTEARNCIAIINAFRLASSPTAPVGTGVLGASIGPGTSFTFGYPHLVQFNINFVKQASVSGQEGQIQTLFRSKVCAIDSVSVDYGGQKMTFFEDGRPTEMNFTIQLTEITPRTVGDARNDAATQNQTIV
jgi:hypothetical protein